MPLEHFRKRKQTIYWIVAIVVIPSFVLAWGVGGALGEGPGSETRIVVDGEKASLLDVDRFHRRLRAVLGTDPRWRLSFGMPYPQDVGIKHSLLLSFAALQEAEKAGIGVDDSEIGTLIQNHRELRSASQQGKEELNKAFRRMIGEYRISHAEFMRGAREWIMISKWVTLVDSMPMATPEAAYLTHVMRKSNIDYVEVRVPITEELKLRAFDQLTGVTEENPDGDMEMLLARVEEYLANNPDDRRLYTDARWKFEYLLAPFDAFVPEISDEDVKDRYEQNKKAYGDKPFEEVRQQVQNDLVEERRRRFAKNTVDRELESFLRKAIQKESVSVDNIMQDELLVQKRGLVSGLSGEDLKPVSDLNTLESLGNCRSVKLFLEQLDQMEPEERDERIATLKENFDTSNPPLECDKGFLRIRLIDYVPSKQPALRDENGEVNSKLRNQVIEILQKEKAVELARAEAETTAEVLREQGPDAIDGNVSEASEPIYRIPAELITAGVNDPVVVPSADGMKILMITDREIPTYSDFETVEADAKAADMDSQSMRLRGQPFMIRFGIVMPGARVQRWAIEGMRFERFQLLKTRQEREQDEREEEEHEHEGEA